MGNTQTTPHKRTHHRPNIASDPVTPQYNYTSPSPSRPRRRNDQPLDPARSERRQTSSRDQSVPDRHQRFSSEPVSNMARNNIPADGDRNGFNAPPTPPLVSCILTDTDLLELQSNSPFTRHGGSQLINLLSSPSNLESFTIAELKAIITYINRKKLCRVRVSGNKAALVSRVRDELFPPRNIRASPAVNGGSTTQSTPISTPASTPGAPNIPRSVVLPPAPGYLDKMWPKLDASYHLQYELVSEVCSRQFVHPSTGVTPPDVVLDFDTAAPSLWKDYLRDQTCRFLLHIFSDPTQTFLNHNLLDSAFKIMVNGYTVPSANTQQKDAGDSHQYLDITSQIRALPPSTTKFRVHVTAAYYYWSAGAVSLLCVEKISTEKAVSKIYEQTLLNAGIKDLPTPSPPPKGFNIFKKCRFPNLESATSMFAEKIVSKVSVTGKGGNPDDDDIEMGNQIISFKCPLTLIRIRVPVRSRKCRHRQCYDCEAFISLNQAPGSKWKCAVCAKALKISDLEIDAPFSRLLSKYSTADRCIILPSGEDVAYTEPSSQRKKSIPPAATKRKSDEIEGVIELDSDPDESGDDDDGEEDDTPLLKRRKIMSPVKKVAVLPDWNGCTIEID